MVGFPRSRSLNPPYNYFVSLRIAHFVQRYPPALGGSEAYFQRLSRHLAQRGHAVGVWTTNAIDLEAFWSSRAKSVMPGIATDGGVIVRRFHCEHWPLRRYILKALSLVPARSTWKAMTMPCNPVCREMWRESGETAERYDVVHATAFPYAWPIVCARRLARRCGAAFFITPFLHLGSRDDPDDRTRRAYLASHLQDLLRSADGIFVQTPWEQDAARMIGIPEEKIILQGMGVDPRECTGGDRQKARQEWKAAEGEVVIGHLANLSAEKGTIDLLDAAAGRWDGRTDDFRVVLAGATMPNFRDYWHTYRHKDRVRILGVLDETQKRDFFSGIDVFALPSRSDSFGLVLLEAWANGVPNVAYRAGGPGELIRDEKDGLLVECGEVYKLGKALSDIARFDETRRRLGEEGRRRTMTEFFWSDKLWIVEEAYQRLRAGSPSG
jgi:glycosyltransferase involved in cell wall biosynthesis